MKKTFKHCLMSAAIVASSLSLASCSNDEDDNGIITGETVKTQFAVSIGSGSQSASRQSNTVVQAAGQPFRGMEKIVLASFNAAAGELNTATPAAVITLDNISTATAEASSKIYSNVSIPINTNHFLFYGKAEIGAYTETLGMSPGVEKNLHFGSIGYNVSESTNSFSATNLFTTKSIKGASDIINSTEAVALAAAMTKIANTKVTIDATEQNAFDVIGVNFVGSNAGSSAAVLKRVNSMLAFIQANIALANYPAVQAAIEGLFTSDADVSKIFTLNNHVAEWKTSTIASIGNFPGFYGLPEGAAFLSWDYATPGTFSYISNGTVGTSVITVPMSNYVYPAELTYYAASPVKASPTVLEAADWSKTPGNWTTNPNLSGSKIGNTAWDDVVRVNSKSVALANNINYGVAQLQTTVKVRETPLGYTNPSTNADQTIAIGAATLPFTGIIIGGQSSNYGYNFLGTDATYADAVYDLVSGLYATTAASDPNYTLVFDNYKSAGQQKVNIALEFKNNTGVDLKGIGGTVYNGQKFYVVGQLDPDKDGLAAIDWGQISSTNAATYFPAYNVKRIFIQDFITKANFTLNSLKNIYVTIPDLRATQISFGLSVDVSWKNGLVFDETIE